MPNGAVLVRNWWSRVVGKRRRGEISEVVVLKTKRNLYTKWLLRKRVVKFDVGIRFLAGEKRGKIVGHEVVT